MLHFSYALQALGHLMEATFATVQFQTGLLAGLVKGILADRPARIIGNAVTASFSFLALFQTKEKLGFIAPSAGFV